MPCLLVVTGPPTPPWRSIKNLGELLLESRPVAGEQQGPRRPARSGPGSARPGPRRSGAARSGRAAACPQREGDLVPRRRVLPTWPLGRRQRQPRVAAQATGTSAGRPNHGRTAHPRDVARPRRCRAARGRAARSRSARTAASGDSGAASPFLAPAHVPTGSIHDRQLVMASTVVSAGTSASHMPFFVAVSPAEIIFLSGTTVRNPGRAPEVPAAISPWGRGSQPGSGITGLAGPASVRGCCGSLHSPVGWARSSSTHRAAARDPVLPVPEEIV